MLNYLDKIEVTTCAKDRQPLASLARAAVCAMAVLAAATGCQTTPQSSSAAPSQAATAASGATNSSKSLVLQEGDTVKIEFPGAPNLDTVQAIRRDGKITLQTVGEYTAAGKTPVEMQAELKKLYGTELVNSEVSVTVQTSAFVIYIMGAVGRPGKLVSDRPLTPMEALIEAGMDASRSNLKAVQVIRTDAAGHTEKFKLNLYKVLHKKAEQMPSFTLKPFDIIDVPERFSFY